MVLNNPNGSNSLSIHQAEYIELLNDMNVQLFTNNNYSNKIDYRDEHCEHMGNIAAPKEEIKFFNKTEP